MSTTQEKTGENKNKLPFGHYRVDLKYGEKSVDSKFKQSETKTIVCKPLTQKDYADGWQPVLPNPSKRNPIHHFSVTLANLPPHLWVDLLKDYEKSSKLLSKNKFKDNIYYYTVSESENDEVLVQLYYELQKRNPDSVLVKNYLEQLGDETSGWLVMRAKKFLS